MGSNRRRKTLERRSCNTNVVGNSCNLKPPRSDEQTTPSAQRHRQRTTRSVKHWQRKRLMLCVHHLCHVRHSPSCCLFPCCFNSNGTGRHSTMPGGALATMNCQWHTNQIHSSGTLMPIGALPRTTWYQKISAACNNDKAARQCGVENLSTKISCPFPVPCKIRFCSIQKQSTSETTTMK
jgi:hypothetical protein